MTRSARRAALPASSVARSTVALLAGVSAAVMLLAALACAAPDSARDHADTDHADTVDSTRSVPAASPAPWYHAVRTLDLTGDGTADRVRLEARRERLDSLQIVLALVVGGEEKHREVWGSSYELALVDSATRGSPRAEAVLRAKLDSVLASVEVEQLGAPGVRLMAEDSAIMAGLAPRPTHRISFSYGYESTTRLVWDAPRSRFVQLWSCC